MAIRRVCWGLVDHALSNPRTGRGHFSSSEASPCWAHWSRLVRQKNAASNGSRATLTQSCVKLVFVSALHRLTQSRIFQLLLCTLSVTSPEPRSPPRGFELVYLTIGLHGSTEGNDPPPALTIRSMSDISSRFSPSHTAATEVGMHLAMFPVCSPTLLTAYPRLVKERTPSGSLDLDLKPHGYYLSND